MSVMLAPRSERRTPLSPVVSNVQIAKSVEKKTPCKRDEEIDVLCSLVTNADLLNDALTSHKKSRHRESFDEAPVCSLNFENEEELYYSSSEDEVEVYHSTLASLKSQVRDKLMTAMLHLINDPTTNETRLKNALAGIGPIRARMLIQVRDQRVHKLFDSVQDALGAVGLSTRQGENLIIANMGHILKKN
uniref:Uncharacterized protein n=1 Tax=Aureoumbra lagunensis TaxID=44058 RepID=A0A7S3JUV4_9STRA|mmetsp:Transcript_18440/g.23991  ORF Transcript_18440/g.23991 Transcript_18440/m.23991 type:complete len:190 (-) Transcript_18440:115-684(-)